ncbi:patatin-like phospholipase family protein [Candidatus Galacturonibacter soehngenii]|uniref:Patatin-like phospholipase family protein n=1 Tax=Candidatus Galacturonatibacter soehngenii TaxID=2307010 RepID=A0A7V7QIP4_9FIRM|nr:patatin-like phospholipase family protein [Candidatus Galacturonibacter soehngenii]KAB1436070.1 patatin-like phospholipase family protein [Candidatus Galacturonibacter soehngenii]
MGVIILNKRINAVFEGGGMRGIGHVGAACIFEKKGYEFVNLAGSSAGAIVASLLAAGYTCEEIRKEMDHVNYMKFKQESLLDRIGTIGKVISILYHYGIYSADYFEEWLNDLLKKKGKVTFKDIKTEINPCGDVPYRLQITASDLTEQKLLILPNDLKDFCIDPDTFPIAKAVRMSMSIPIFYEPYRLMDCNGKEHYIVDGGLLSNYPIWIFDKVKAYPPCHTIGFKFIDEAQETKREVKDMKMNIIEYIWSLASTGLNAKDKQYISASKGDYQRTVTIPTIIQLDGKEKNIGATDFGISDKESDALFYNGSKAARHFLDVWNYDQWKKTYQSSD